MDRKDFIGKEIGNYHIIAEINSGSYGSVYKAEHTHLKERVVAIKLLHTYMGSPEEREQFAQEAQFLALLEHPNILPLLDFGFSERQPYLIAKYAAEGSLRHLLKRQAPLPIKQAVNILTQVGQALYCAHQHNIIHRDLKPDNILFNAQGDALLADFGIATMLSTASFKQLAINGTPPYMSPEQFQGIISKESDQYALGCIAYELVTGYRPFTAPDLFSMGFKHLTEQPVAPTLHNTQLPLSIEAAILKAMGKQRAERYADIPTFLAALQAPFKPAIVVNVAPTTSLIPSTFQASTPSTSTSFISGRSATPKMQSVSNVAPPTPHISSAAQASIPPASALPTPSGSKDPAMQELWARTRARWPKEQWVSEGMKYYDNQSYPEALIAFEQAIRLDPNYASAYHNKGAALRSLKRFEEAINAYDQAIRLDPNYLDTYVGKGYALERLGRKAEAEQVYEQAQQRRNSH